MNRILKKRLKTSTFIILGFILGCTFTIGLMPIDRTCKIDDTDKEFNIMKNSKFKNPELIILILSAPKNFGRRDVCRETWLRLNPKSQELNVLTVKHYFVIGTISISSIEQRRLTAEQSLYNDILMLPIEDSYKNLTEKVKYSFQWLDTQYDYGLGFKYVLKCDDDSFVNIKPLILELKSMEKNYVRNRNAVYTTKEISINYQVNNNAKHLHLYWGYFKGNARIMTKGKWREPNWIASDRYTPYALGGGYLLSKELVSYIARNMKELKSFNSEDVSVGLWLLLVNNIVRIHDIRFDTEWTSRGCKNYHLITHNVIPGEMRQLYESLMKTGQLCSQEKTIRHHYVYDWNVPPSQCCKSVQEKIIKLP